MELDADKLLEHAIRDGIRDGIKAKLTGYQTPLDKLMAECIDKHRESFRTLLDDALRSCVGNEQFRENIAESVRSILARTLVQRFGGEMEKQVNALKSDPTTRARMTLAIEDIVRQKAS